MINEKGGKHLRPKRNLARHTRAGSSSSKEMQTFRVIEASGALTNVSVSSFSCITKVGTFVVAREKNGWSLWYYRRGRTISYRQGLTKIIEEDPNAYLSLFQAKEPYSESVGTKSIWWIQFLVDVEVQEPLPPELSYDQNWIAHLPVEF